MIEPAGIGTLTGPGPFVAVIVVTDGRTLSDIVRSAGPPGKSVPPCDPGPPSSLYTVRTWKVKLSSPVKPGEGGV